MAERIAGLSGLDRPQTQNIASHESVAASAIIPPQDLFLLVVMKKASEVFGTALEPHTFWKPTTLAEIVWRNPGVCS